MQEQLISLLTQWNNLEQKNVAGSLVGQIFAQRTRITAYLRSQTPAILSKEIGQVATMHDVRVLLGCNPKGAIYDLVNARKLAMIGTAYLWPQGITPAMAQGNTQQD